MVFHDMCLLMRWPRWLTYLSRACECLLGSYRSSIPKTLLFQPVDPILLSLWAQILVGTDSCGHHTFLGTYCENADIFQSSFPCSLMAWLGALTALNNLDQDKINGMTHQNTILYKEFSISHR